MPLTETVILIGALAAGAGLPRKSWDIYLYGTAHPGLERALPEETTKVSWVKASGLPGITAANTPDEHFFGLAFERVGVLKQEGFKLLQRAKEILTSSEYPVTRVLTGIVQDLEDGTDYLTMRLQVDAGLEKALELDYLLAEGLVSSFETLPERLSFAVYERDHA